MKFFPPSTDEIGGSEKRVHSMAASMKTKTRETRIVPGSEPCHRGHVKYIKWIPQSVETYLSQHMKATERWAENFFRFLRVTLSMNSRTTLQVPDLTTTKQV
jgi:hypothetical protein